MNLLEFIQIHHLQNYIYLILFFGMFVDAVITTFVAVFLMTTGALPKIFGSAVIITGIYIEQMFYYWVGLKLSRRKRIMAWIEKAARPFDKHLNAKTFRTLAVSKFIYGLHRAMLVRAGMLKIPFKIFAKYGVFISLIWIGIIGSLALFFSASYEVLSKYIRYAELIPLGLVIIYGVADWQFSKRLKKEL